MPSVAPTAFPEISLRISGFNLRPASVLFQRHNPFAGGAGPTIRSDCRARSRASSRLLGQGRVRQPRSHHIRIPHCVRCAMNVARPMVVTSRATRDSQWSRVETEDELVRWEAAWAAAGSPTISSVFLPTLLTDSSLAFFRADDND